MATTMRTRPEFHVVDLAATFLRRDAGVDLQLVVTRGTAVPRRPTPRPRSRSSRTPGSSSASRRCATSRLPCGASSSSIHRPTPCPMTQPPMKCFSAVDPADLDELGAATARRSGDAHLHVGHDRAAKGRDDPERNVVFTCEQLTPLLRVRARRQPRCGDAHRVVPADGAHRRAHPRRTTTESPLRLPPSHAARTRRRSPTMPREVHPEVMFGVPRVREKVYLGVDAALARGPRQEAEVRRGRRRGEADPRSPARRRHGHPRAAGDLGLPRRRRLQHRPRPSVSTLVAPRYHRRGADDAPRCSSGSTPSASRSARSTG